MSPRTTRMLCLLYGASLRCYPREFRDRFGEEMQQTFRDRCGQSDNLRAFLQWAARDWITTFLREGYAHMSEIVTTPRKWTLLRKAAVTAGVLLAGAIVLLGVSATVLQAFVVPTSSMEGSLQAGDHLLVNKTVRVLSRGDLAVFRPPDNPQVTFIKRVIGLPGDRIRIENKQVIRNGRPLKEPYVQHLSASYEEFRDNFPSGTPGIKLGEHGESMLEKHLVKGEIVVPPGCLFVLGDNRDMSLDSRYFGFVPQENVVGRTWLVYWSYDSAKSKTRWERTLMVTPQRDGE